MTVHLYMNYKCEEEECDCVYIPYNETIVCPKCGHKPEMEDYYPLVEGICESFLHNIGETHDFLPMAWITMDISDVIQMIMFHIFKKWVGDHPDAKEESRDEDFKEFSDESIGMIDFKDQPYMEDYMKKLCMDVYEAFFRKRGIVLAVDDKNNITVAEKNEN